MASVASGGGLNGSVSPRPFTGTLAVQLTILAVRGINCRRDSVITEGYNAPARFPCVRAISGRPARRTGYGTPVRDYPTRTSQMSGQFTGDVVNTTSNLEASAELALQQTNGALTGCFVVFRPLYGSGQVTGSVHGTAFAFVAQSPNFDITFTGHRDGENLNGTYVVTRGGTGLQNGTFKLSRSHTAPADGLKSSDCRND